MEPINNILSNHNMAAANPNPPSHNPFTDPDNEFPDPFAKGEETEEATLKPEELMEHPTTDISTTDSSSESTDANDYNEQTALPTNNTQLQSLKRNIHAIQDQLSSMLRTIQMMQGMNTSTEVSPTPMVSAPLAMAIEQQTDTEEGQIIEGVFDGMQMVGPDGKTYSIPPNYASKSKLVEGDFMKLTITPSGKFLYKQIGPIERKRIIGELVQGADEEQWSVLAEGRAYHVLKASVTFHNARPGDEVVILVPKDGESSWGAVENVMHK